MITKSSAHLSFLLLFLVGGVVTQRSRTIQCVPGKAQFPNPNDRHSFYKCDAGGNPILFQCPPGTWFNPRLEVCDWDTGKTSGTNEQIGNGNSNGGNGQPTKPPNSGSNSGQSTVRPTNPWNNGNGNSNGNNLNSGQTTRAPNGVSNTVRPSNPWSNGQGNVNQGNNGNTNGPSGSNLPTISNWWSGPIDEEERESPGGRGPVEGERCEPRGFRSQQNPADCSTFFTCNSQGRIQRSSCPSGLYFSPERLTCLGVKPTGCVITDDAWARR